VSISYSGTCRLCDNRARFFLIYQLSLVTPRQQQLWKESLLGESAGEALVRRGDWAIGEEDFRLRTGTGAETAGAARAGPAAEADHDRRVNFFARAKTACFVTSVPFALDKRPLLRCGARQECSRPRPAGAAAARRLLLRL
jgi:hypothetical protein